ncbi:unnamed protein product [Phytophthora fragariaefolia]|uniref:Unnamed protein product n=1 Tax=Phytophthora fragariaefolia TaxID=1490495 RepID=A0A9W6XLA6_9STRA|nr:unnamed protein product [Phytophthora fragariaefolia]
MICKLLCINLGWWNETLSVAFLKFYFGCRVPQQPVLLLWDDFSGHWTDLVKSYAASINVFLLKVPPHATPVSQPAEVMWTFPLKVKLRQCWHDDMKAQIRQARGISTPLKIRRPTRATICNWVLKAWGEL